METSSQKANTMNSRTFERNIPSQNLQPYFSPRPASTKYARMPIVDIQKPSTVPVKQMATYNIDKVFNPGNGMAPWSGFSSHINKESELRNQIYALQDCSQAAWVPGSNSDLYGVHWKEQSLAQPFPNLFEKQEFNSVNPNPNSNIIGYELFNNATRQQNKNITNC